MFVLCLSIDPTHLMKLLTNFFFNLVQKRPINTFAVYHLPLTIIQLVKAFATVMCTYVQYELRFLASLHMCSVCGALVQTARHVRVQVVIPISMDPTCRQLVFLAPFVVPYCRKPRFTTPFYSSAVSYYECYEPTKPSHSCVLLL